jgi:hypothetical protein
MSSWEVETTDQFNSWYGDLSDDDSAAIDAAVERLIDAGPALGRPTVDTLTGSTRSNLKELRAEGTLRVLFAFDPRRTAILLIGGDKRGVADWYVRMIPVAESLYAEHLVALRKEGLI